jgi:acetyl esterase/lipase
VVRIIFEAMAISNFLVASACLAMTAILSGCASSATPPPLPAAIPLWNGVAPGSEGHDSPEKNSIEHVPATTNNPEISFAIVENVNSPSITPFLPEKGKATGVGVIVIPGGGHRFLAIEHEGYTVGRWLADHGVAGFVLKYRLAKEAGSPYSVDVHELMDVQRAIRLVRSRAGDWGVDPAKIGIMGFSAGGELAIKASTRFEQPVRGTNEAVDQISCRPDFQVLMYPGGLNDPNSVVIDKNTPPAFLACSYTDRISISENLAAFYIRLKAAGIPAELHIYESGGHGFGIRPTTLPVGTWPDRFMDWLRDRGLVQADR